MRKRRILLTTKISSEEFEVSFGRSWEGIPWIYIPDDISLDLRNIYTVDLTLESKLIYTDRDIVNAFKKALTYKTDILMYTNLALMDQMVAVIKKVPEGNDAALSRHPLHVLGRYVYTPIPAQAEIDHEYLREIVQFIDFYFLTVKTASSIFGYENGVNLDLEESGKENQN